MLRPFALVSRLVTAAAATLTVLVVMSSRASALVPPPGPAGSGGTIQVPAAPSPDSAGVEFHWALLVVLAIAAIMVGAALVLATQRLRVARPRIAG